MTRFSLFLALSLLAISQSVCQARLGETAIQCVDRYGPPKNDAATKSEEKNFPLLKGAIEHTYFYQGWKIRAAFLTLDGPAVRMQFQKVPAVGQNIQVQDYEIESILKANANGVTWSRCAVLDFTFPKQWQRSDGAIAKANSIVVQLELPAAKQFEESAAQKQKARASVPNF